MTITQNKVVHIHYTLKNNNGQTIDSSEGQAPLAYLHGHANIIPGLERALEGKKKGDKINVSIAPEEAYGLRNDALVQEVPLTEFPPEMQPEVGHQFAVQMPDGDRIATIVEVNAENAVVDFNHPLAGETLNFEVEIQETRDASSEELAHGHIHGEGGHHH